jgi:hypothetical protein
MTTGSLSEYARHIGAAPSYVTKLKAQGRLVMRDESGRQVVDFELSDRLIRNTADLGRARNGANAAPGRPPSAPLAPVADGGRVDAIFRQAQAQERAFNAKMAELEYRKMAGELVPIDEVRGEVARLATALRESIMQLPARLGPVVAAESDAAKCIAAIEAELRQALRQSAEAAAE